MEAIRSLGRISVSPEGDNFEGGVGGGGELFQTRRLKIIQLFNII